MQRDGENYHRKKKKSYICYSELVKYTEVVRKSSETQTSEGSERMKEKKKVEANFLAEGEKEMGLMGPPEAYWRMI